jgi:hypothetical protein
MAKKEKKNLKTGQNRNFLHKNQQNVCTLNSCSFATKHPLNKTGIYLDRTCQALHNYINVVELIFIKLKKIGAKMLFVKNVEKKSFRLFLS